jgi:4-alpha-glucanotransferase
MHLPRASGILLHPTSLPSPYGIGELGSSARGFIDFLAQTSQQFWQVLPLGPTGYGNSPYMCYSASAGNPLLISLEVLQEDGLLTAAQVQPLTQLAAERVDYDRVIAAKLPLLRHACETFKAQASAEQQAAFRDFCDQKADWLDDYVLFMALKQTFNNVSWFEWDAEIAQRQPLALQTWRSRLAHEIDFHQFLQFEFFRQWASLKQYAGEQGIQIIGDIPIYVAHDSADVWAHPQNFCLDPETGEVAQMAGVPPDYFSATGQLWGNPVYNWDYLQETGFRWWIQRFEAMLDYVDWIRIDHFRGFEAFWAVPQGEGTAINGEWIKAPGEEFFEVLNQDLGKLPILAEDLGVITPEVEALRDKFEFPGMKVLHFAFGSDPGNPFLPFNYPRNCLVYTGTHDNNTTIGWFESLPDWERDNLLIQIGSVSPDGIHWDLIRQAMSSVADLCIIPMQDILGLGEAARMNYPSVPEGNWEWCFRPDMITPNLEERLKTMTYRFRRAPLPKPTESSSTDSPSTD